MHIPAVKHQQVEVRLTLIPFHIDMEFGLERFLAPGKIQWRPPPPLPPPSPAPSSSDSDSEASVKSIGSSHSSCSDFEPSDTASLSELLRSIIRKKYARQHSLPGFKGSLFFYAHGHNALIQKGEEERKKDKVRLEAEEDMEEGHFETQLNLAVFRHLNFNGVSADEIQFLTNSDEIFDKLQKVIYHQWIDAYAKLTISDIREERACLEKSIFLVHLCWDPDLTAEDMTELAKKLTYLICMAKFGVMIVAPFELVFNKTGSAEWTEVVTTLFQHGKLHPSLELHCTQHNLYITGVEDGATLQYVSPNGGCNKMCVKKDCGHPCGNVCHPHFQKHDGFTFVCKEPCEKTCARRHPCLKKCGEPCKCRRGCFFLHPCGHRVEDNEESCKRLCTTVLSCGHHCPKECGSCVGPHDDVKCKERCFHLCADKLHRCLKRCCDPCGPCDTEVSLVLPCGHEVKKKCYESEELMELRCTQPCRRFVCIHHRCKRLCYQDCGVCEENVLRRQECGHMIETPCHSPVPDKCCTLVAPPIPSKCGHDILIQCYQSKTIDSDQLIFSCKKGCQKLLECGHTCPGDCYLCFTGRFHSRCNEPCGKVLVCGHACHTPCSSVCPPCASECVALCEHYRCPYQCGVPCDYVCEEPCPYVCPHLKCGRKCGESCDRPGCMEHCSLLLDCGHPCTGFCGEKCPPACRICSPEKLLDLYFGDPLDESNRFYYIETCGHTVESSCLEHWLKSVLERDEISALSCPICRVPLILSTRRFSSLMFQSWKELQQVKLKVCGDEDYIREEIIRVTNTVQARLPFVPEQGPLQKVARFILHEIGKWIKGPGEEETEPVATTSFISPYRAAVDFLSWTCSQWEMALAKLEKARTLYPEETPYYNTYCAQYGNFLGFLVDREWPLHPNEMNDLKNELIRLADMELLYSRVSLKMEPHLVALALSKDGKSRLAKAEEILTSCNAYSPEQQEKFRQKYEKFAVIQNFTLQITEEERVEIVAAFGSKAGRWFKCPNGHVYVVTECGGVTEISKCFECGAVIGGEKHRVTELNPLASEMDGAEDPMYPTAMM